MKRKLPKGNKPQDKWNKWKRYSPLTRVIKLFISINGFFHFYASNSLPCHTEGEQGRSFMGLSCLLQLSHDSSLINSKFSIFTFVMWSTSQSTLRMGESSTYNFLVSLVVELGNAPHASMLITYCSLHMPNPYLWSWPGRNTSLCNTNFLITVCALLFIASSELKYQNLFCI